MKPITLVFWIAIILVSMPLAGADSTATIHGVVYEWDTFEPTDNAYIEINTTPIQSIVPQYGIYSLELPPGNYLITATSYKENNLEYSTEVPLTITDNGTYVIDLLLMPVYSDIVESDENEKQQTAQAGTISIVFYLLLAIVLMVAIERTTSKTKKDKKRHYIEPEIEITEYPAPGHAEEVLSEDEDLTYPEDMKDLPSDLQEIVKILLSNDGRMTQKDLRSKIDYSEGKVSMMLNDLEKNGWVEKRKEGRGNIIFLKDEHKSE
ncbi:helix-turn-helix transcriptional regulator [Methanococcoides alaskense]|uniref:Membrane protein n=1 Tax=Methanococcoides alaskense TaxID=325778 RepID=A0AA90TYL9_9EURY|nr:winged helix-turn-helix transcriptional regulator [Methanococcoides alaskense]MDA0525544.1 winged helix-turn-helix transcriptional regulator [Methanococcoides alaskense]MDR6222325.1 putative membrane protein [Methanococcoides alaskense]